MLIKFDIRCRNVLRRGFVIDTSKDVSVIHDPAKDITISNISILDDVEGDRWDNYTFSIEGTSERFRWKRKEVS